MLDVASVGMKPKGILSHRETRRVEQVDGECSQASADPAEMLTGSAALDYYELLCKVNMATNLGKMNHGNFLSFG